MATVQENIVTAELLLDSARRRLASSAGPEAVQLATAYAGLAAIKLTAEAVEANRVAMDRMVAAAEEF